MTTVAKLFIAAAFVPVAPGAWAQSASPVTVTPYVAFGTAGASPIGVMVTTPLGAGLSVESEVAYRRGEGDIKALSYNLSLLQDLPRAGRVTPYLAGGVGLAQHGVPVVGAEGPPTATESRLALTLNAGAGLKVPVRSNLQFRSFGAPRARTP